jgi:hypothetical protein
MISAGGMYPIAFDVKDTTGALTHATTATLTITLPDGTTATPAITDATVSGQYRLAYQTTIPGRYTAHATTTGPVTSFDDEFDASPTPWPAIISLADAKAQLNMPLTDHSKDDLLRDYIAGITGAAEDYVNETIVRRVVTDRLDLCYGTWGWGRHQFRLWMAPVQTPLISVISWDGTITWDVTKLWVTQSGVVHVVPGGIPVTGLVDVTYAPGYAQVPGRYRRGALVMLQHVWETQRGGSPLGAMGGVIGPEEHFRQPGEFFTIPAKAKEWFGPPRPVVA